MAIKGVTTLHTPLDSHTHTPEYMISRNWVGKTKQDNCGDNILEY